MKEFLKAKYIPAKENEKHGHIKFSSTLSDEHLDMLISRLVAYRKERAAARKPKRKLIVSDGISPAQATERKQKELTAAKTMPRVFEAVCFAVVGSAKADFGQPYLMEDGR